MPSHYRLNEPDVSAEMFDGEVLAINLANGHYFSVLGTGVLVWQHLVAQGCSVDETAAALALAYPGEPEAAASDARAFVAELEAAGLVVPVPGPSAPAFVPAAAVTPAGSYASPVLENYTDMKELLLIDPIHEVDVYAGWPNKPPAQDAA